jgi:hypothetical protein
MVHQFSAKSLFFVLGTDSSMELLAVFANHFPKGWNTRDLNI